MNRATLAALALLLDDCAQRLEDNQRNQEGPPLSECLRLAEAKRLSEELRHLLSLPPSMTMERLDAPTLGTPDQGSVPDNSGINPNLHASRITSKIASGEIRRVPIGTADDEEVLNMGMGRIEISENDEVTDVVEKPRVRVLPGHFPHNLKDNSTA